MEKSDRVVSNVQIEPSHVYNILYIGDVMPKYISVYCIVCIFTVQVAFAVADSVRNSRICRKMCVALFLQNRIFASGSAIFALRAPSTEIVDM